MPQAAHSPRQLSRNKPQKGAAHTPRTIANPHHNDKNINHKMKTSFFFAIALALFALLVVTAAADETASNGDVAVNVQGKSARSPSGSRSDRTRSVKVVTEVLELR